MKAYFEDPDAKSTLGHGPLESEMMYIELLS